jgi:hypothetical protein
MTRSSSGLLLYAALVDLLAEDFLSAEGMSMTKKDRAVAFGCVILGGKSRSILPGGSYHRKLTLVPAIGMSIVGAFA